MGFVRDISDKSHTNTIRFTCSFDYILTNRELHFDAKKTPLAFAALKLVIIFHCSLIRIFNHRYHWYCGIDFAIKPSIDSHQYFKVEADVNNTIYKTCKLQFIKLFFFYNFWYIFTSFRYVVVWCYYLIHVFIYTGSFFLLFEKLALCPAE